ncbi:metal-dependent hydrolase [Marinigracilibium pacificum]|uniref:Metal-dependent hydrolase n=1 Tax=Marinigracilibium pacificum TaxID=2729599 RepID=A0A848J6K7_9BACT|nr:metal-dependent hydrolase [Marinigracilibium pacificum]NMM50878.1 metal-dependent hydrolase [Marinigracilibium pacificum]
MASLFGHAFAALSTGSILPSKVNLWKLIALGMICSIIPDADVIAFKFGIPYESIWGHRGFTHSFLFAFMLSLILTVLFYKNYLFTGSGIIILFYLFISTSSHLILDALTTGGLGVAAFFPFDNNRYFLPWRPIKVSPIGLGNFFTSRGLAVIKSELLWVGVPGVLFIGFSYVLKRIFASKS